MRAVCGCLPALFDRPVLGQLFARAAYFAGWVTAIDELNLGRDDVAEAGAVCDAVLGRDGDETADRPTKQNIGPSLRAVNCVPSGLVNVRATCAGVGRSS